MESKITVSTGVVFKIKKAPSLAFQTIVANLKKNEPKVPILENKNKGRKEENPNDPDYLKAITEYDNKTNLALLDAAIILCTEIDSLPEGFEKPEDPAWFENMAVAGISIEQLGIDHKRQRYLSWVKFHAAPMDEDILAFNKEIARLNGVSEGDVTAAMAAYKST
jgi:hypothetical protein